MSHVIDIGSMPENERIKCQVRLPEVFLAACRKLGLVTMTDIEEQLERGVKNPQKGRGRYVGHKTVNGRLVGDWPIPKGWTYDDVDNNASYVIRLGDKDRARLGKYAYDLGLVWDEKDQCYYPVYDFADMGGRAMSAIIGGVRTDHKTKTVTTAYDKLMQIYNVMCVEHLSKEANQETETQDLEDGSTLIYTYLDDAGTEDKIKEAY